MTNFFLYAVLAWRERKLLTSFLQSKTNSLKAQDLEIRRLYFEAYKSLKDEEEVVELLTLIIKKLSYFSTF